MSSPFHPDITPGTLTFGEWHARLEVLALPLGWDVSDREAWRDLFEENLTPEEAIHRDLEENT